MGDGPLLRRAPSPDPAEAADRTDVEAPASLDSRQLRIWLLEQLQPGTSLHNVAVAVRLDGQVDRASLRRALDAFVVRHPELGTAYRAGAEGPTALLPTHNGPSAGFVLREVSAPARDVLENVLAEEAQEPFDLATPPLLRATLVERSEAEHVLALVTHEIAWRRGERDALVVEIADLYRASLDGDYPATPVESRPPTAAAKNAADLAYWRAVLRNAPPLLDLPTDHARPPVQSFAGRRVTRALPADMLRSIENRAREWGIDVGTIVLSAFAALLHRYSGQVDLLAGILGGSAIPTATGDTLVVQLDLTGEPSFGELVQRVAASVRTSEEHPVPFECLIDELDPERDLSRPPLFQVACRHERVCAPFERGGLCFTPAEIDTGSCPVDLALTVSEAWDVTCTVLDHSRDLFDEATAARMLGHLHTIVGAGLAAPETTVARLPLLTADERLLRAAANRTALPFPRESLHELVSAQAVRTPQRVAVVSDAETLTYGELEEGSSRLAYHLRSLGVGPGTPVGLCLERSARLPVAMLGILKTGGFYVPLDSEYPSERMGFMLDDSEAEILVTESSLLSRMPEREGTVVFLDGLPPQIAQREARPPVEADTSDDLAYVIYTSGSTGVPKGVEIRHRSVVNLLTHMRREPGLFEDDVLVNLTTPAFDLSVPDWYLPLVCGARLVIVPREATADAEQVAARLEAAGATFVQATPTTWAMLVDSGWPGAANLKIVCGGEPLPRRLAEQLLERGESVWHMYGPTETTVWSSIRRLETGDGPPPIGGPIANTTFHVLDGGGEPVPDGVPGELFIGGVGVARGYRRRPELTAERFVDDPSAGGGRAKLYATGDLVRTRPAGTLEFLGRLDHQVKIRGFRVELGEIEAALNKEPSVAASAVIAREDAPGDQRLVAYVVGASEKRVEPRALSRALARRLPAYMLPATFVVLDALPTSANGKLDRSALPAPAAERPDLDHPFVAPRTPVEEIVTGVWGEVLGLERVGVDDDFFQLGGNSLLATRALMRLRDRLGVAIPLRAVFETPTARGLGLMAVHALAESLLEEDEDLSSLFGELDSADARSTEART
ncbi:MAG TPA: amino acid adenylation domain-containing protein [Gaiellaceae bacterium]